VVQEAVAAGVLTAEADRLVFRHEVIRQALVESLPASARNALHLQAGQALAAAGARVERAAQHLLAGMTLDGRTLAWLAGAADRLSARAPALAADLLRRAVDTADPAGAQTVSLRLALAGALLRAGRFAEAQAAAIAGLAVHDGPGTGGKPGAEDAAAASSGPNPGGRLRWILVQASLNQGHVTEALQQTQQALDGGGLSRAERARFHGLAAQCLHVLSPGGPGLAMQAAEGAPGPRAWPAAIRSRWRTDCRPSRAPAGGRGGSARHWTWRAKPRRHWTGPARSPTANWIRT
jgi:hypothetical protein